MDRPDTSIRYLVWRLCIFCAVLLIVSGDRSTASAQVAGSENVYTIIGDVQLPGNYQWFAGQRVTLQMVLERARGLSQSGRAVIRKANEPERAIPLEVRSGNARTIFLTPRDTIVWHSVSGPNLQSGNVVFLTDQGPLLRSIPMTGVDLPTVLQQADLSTDQRVLVHRSDWTTQQSFPLASRGLVQHGDVLDVRSVVFPVANAEQLPVISRPSTGPLRAVSSPTNLPQFGSSSTYHQNNVPSIPNGGLQIPDGGSNGAAVQIEEVSQASPPAATGSLEIPTGDFESLGSVQVPETTVPEITVPEMPHTGSPESISSTMADLEDLANEVIQPTASVQDADSHAFLNGVFLFGLVLAIGLITIGIVRTRQEQRLHDQMRVGTEPQLATTASSTELFPASPPAGVEASADVSSLEVSDLSPESFTQLPVFSAEPPQVTGESLPDPLTQTTVEEASDVELDDCPVLSVGLESTELTKPVDQADHLENESSESPADFEPRHETLNVATWLNDDSEDVGIDEEDQAEVDRVLADTHSKLMDESSRMDESDAPILKLPDVDAIRESLTLNSVSKSELQGSENHDVRLTADEVTIDSGQIEPESIESVAASEEPEQHDQIADLAVSVPTDRSNTLELPRTLQDQDEDMDHPSMTKAEADYLEDLIQNRLPMELSDAQLPLKINLFGKPEGPRRLRIDAAHSTIAPPHMARAARQTKRREPAVATAVEKSQQQPVAGASQTSSATNPAGSAGQSIQESTRPAESASQQTASTGSQSPASGLDKALNFLEEQSKS